MQIRCTNCAADVPIGASSSEVVCPYCETLLFVGKQTGIPHVILSEYVTSADAILRLGRHLSNMEINDPPKVLARQKVYLPYWQLHFSQKTRKAVWVAASPSPSEDLLIIDAHSGDSKSKTSLDVPDHLLVKTEVLLEDALLATSFNMSELDKDKPATLVHVPFEKIQYLAVGETLDAYVDLVTGTVHGDSFPATPQREKSRVLGAVSAASLLAVVSVVATVPWQGSIFLVPLLLLILYVFVMKLLSRLGW